MTDETSAPEHGLTAVERLVAIEEIKQLKARYFRFIDTKDWESFPSIFTDDCKHYYVPSDGPETHMGNDEYLPMMKATLSDGVTTHHGHTPEITFTSRTEAEAIWPMFDYVQVTAAHGRISIMGWGHYFETYRQGDDGRWRMSSKRNVRLRVDNVPWTLPDS